MDWIGLDWMKDKVERAAKHYSHICSTEAIIDPDETSLPHNRALLMFIYC